jgi:hypothetical protein
MPEPRRIVPDGSIRPGLNLSGSTIAANRIVVQSTLVDQVAQAAAATAPYYGVTMNAIANGVTGDIQTGGKATIEAGAAVAKNVNVMSDASGRAILATAGNNVIGRTVVASTALGQVLEVELCDQPTILAA